jgi:SAM-dependent methyltransferase
VVEHLPVVIPVRRERESGINDDHPMRKVTREVAFAAGTWDDSLRVEVARLFDGLAPEWHTRDAPGRYDALEDALDRGAVPTDAVAVELGSGTGLATPLLAVRFPRLVAADLSIEMLRIAPADAAPRLQLDSSCLPFADRSIPVVLAVNMLLFPAEVDRVLAEDGVFVWVNTSGPDTPIFLSADDVVAALGKGWSGRASEAGTGTWCAARRSP